MIAMCVWLLAAARQRAWHAEVKHTSFVDLFRPDHHSKHAALSSASRLQVLEVHEQNSGRKPFPVFLRRARLPKVRRIWQACSDCDCCVPLFTRCNGTTGVLWFRC